MNINYLISMCEFLQLFLGMPDTQSDYKSYIIQDWVNDLSWYVDTSNHTLQAKGSIMISREDKAFAQVRTIKDV